MSAPVSIREIRDLVLEIRDAMKQLNVEREKQNRQLQEQISLLNASLSLSVRLTGDENLARLQAYIGVALRLRAALMALDAHPLMAMISIVSTLMAVGESIEIGRRAKEW